MAVKNRPTIKPSIASGGSDDGDFVGIDRDGRVLGGFERRDKREKHGEKFINYEVVALSDGSASGSATDGNKEYLGE